MGLGEYFFQRRAQALAERIPEFDRQELDALVHRAMEYGSASEVLWAHEHPAHALREEHRALITLLAALEKVNPAWLSGKDSSRPNPEAPSLSSSEPGAAVAAPALSEPAPEPHEQTTPAEAAHAATDVIDEEWDEPAPAETVAPSDVAGADTATAVPSELTGADGSNHYTALPLFRFSKRARGAIERAIAAKQAPDFPESNDGMTRDHQALYDVWVRGREELTPRLLTLLPSVRSIRALRRRRVTVALGWLVFAMACALYAFRGWSKGFAVLASSTFGPSFAQQAATDGDENTEWLLPEAQDGFVEVVFNRSRALSRVKILNAHNPPYNDRATRDFQLLVYSTDGAPLTLKRSFTTLTASPTWMTVDIPPQRVKRLRIEVKNYHKRGGGLAEVAWE